MRVTAIVAPACLTLIACSSAFGQFVYETVPYVLTELTTGDEYTLSGAITTSCNDCSTDSLSPVEIISGFRIEVTGPSGFVFDSTTGAVILPATDGFTVSPTSISLMEFDSLIFDQSTDSDMIGVGWFGFVSNQPPFVTYPGPGGVDAFADFPDAIGGPFVVATFVPEPSANMLVGLATIGLMLSRRHS